MQNKETQKQQFWALSGVTVPNTPSFVSRAVISLYLVPIICFDALVAAILIICRQVKVN